jgi:RNA polymerase sigma-70 factor (ECF subfamily)
MRLSRARIDESAERRVLVGANLEKHCASKRTCKALHFRMQPLALRTRATRKGRLTYGRTVPVRLLRRTHSRCAMRAKSQGRPRPGGDPNGRDAWKCRADAAMDRYARGDDAAFSELYDVLAPRLYGFLVRQTRDADVASDLLQQTFLRMHCARCHFAPGAEVAPWVFAIARRLQIDSVRRDQAAPVARTTDGVEADASHCPSTEARPDENIGRKELARRLEHEFALLPERNRLAFQLVKIEELSMAEAATVLGITVAAVRTRAHRAYLALREALGDQWE